MGRPHAAVAFPRRGLSRRPVAQARRHDRQRDRPGQGTPYTRQFDGEHDIPTVEGPILKDLESYADYPADVADWYETMAREVMRALGSERRAPAVSPRTTRCGAARARPLATRDVLPRGQAGAAEMLVDVGRLEREYYARRPDLDDPDQLVALRHQRPPRLARSTAAFTEAHILAITQAICEYRRGQGIDGPLYMGKDTHALSGAGPAHRARGAGRQRRARRSSSATTASRRRRSSRARSSSTTAAARAHLADGIVITPSHNPPEDGGFKYNPPNGGPADTDVTRWIQDRANELLRRGQRRREARAATTRALTRRDDAPGRLRPALRATICANVVDMDAIRGAGLTLGVDPLGGASPAYWEPINARLRARHRRRQPDDRSDVRVHDRRSRRQDPHGLLEPLRDGPARRPQGSVPRRLRQRPRRGPPRHRHAVGGADEPEPLPGRRHRLPARAPPRLAGGRRGRQDAGQQQHDRPRGRKLGRRLCEVPVGFKWFVAGPARRLAAASAARRAPARASCGSDGTVWTTDKDGLILGLLAAEITARTGRDPGEHYRDAGRGVRHARTTRASTPPATPEQKARLRKLSPDGGHGDDSWPASRSPPS